jgi:ankyrin repeat protein
MAIQTICKYLLACIPAFTLVLGIPWGLRNVAYASPEANLISIAKVKQDLPNRNRMLLLASQRGDAEAVRSLIGQATDVNVRDQYGWTPLLWAAMNGHTEVVRVLLVSGANPNTRNRYEWTPLMWAAAQGYDEIVRSLIAFGARLNAQDRNGWTALMWAKDSQQDKVVSILQNAIN